MNETTEIAIIGGGIGGLTTAICLEHFGITNYKVYEQALEFREVGAAISLWPNALQVYKAIGLMDKLSPHWGAFSKAYIKTNKGKILSTAVPNYQLPAVCIHRAHLLETLLQNVPKNKLFTDYKLAKTVDKANGVQIEFANGKRVDADIVIGADGINSVLRQEIIGDGAPIYRGYNIWRGIACLPEMPSGYGSETWGKGARVGIVPIKDELFGWWATLNEPKDQSDEPEGTLLKLKQHFGDWHQPIPLLFDRSEKIIKNPLGDRKPHKGWHKGHRVLMGDAAHATTPNLGQGACMTIEGAYLLAKCLAHYNEPTKAFTRYENLHYKRSSDVIKQSLQNGKMGQLENAAAIKARNSMFFAMPDKLAMNVLDKYFGYDVTQTAI
jgi:2-polyprenyl-6-methoxyphenol hydroxylase-like FAD-dependent oxidoreductase